MAETMVKDESPSDEMSPRADNIPIGSPSAAESKALVPVITPPPESKDGTPPLRAGSFASGGSLDRDSKDRTPPLGAGSFTSGGSLDRDLVLAKLNQERRFSLIKAWEENKKAKSLHRLNRAVAKIAAWEKARKAKSEAKMRSVEEKLEKKKAAYVEKMKNEMAHIHMKAEEERAIAKAHHGETVLKAEEMAAKYRASGSLPRRYSFCFGC